MMELISIATHDTQSRNGLITKGGTYDFDPSIASSKTVLAKFADRKCIGSGNLYIAIREI